MDAAKEYWAVNHCQSPRFLPEGEGQDHRYKIARKILSYNPKSVLEFGCSSGRNLVALRQLSDRPDLELVGVDINQAALQAGQRAHPDLDLRFGDESWLHKETLNREYDVVFTVSVLDHIPHWKPIYYDLKSLAKKALILLEPILEEDGKLYEGDLQNKVDAAPFTYSWNYEKNDPKLKRIGDLPITEIPGTLGPLYKVFVYERK